MSQDKERPSFLDDPRFQKSLADLDEGLHVERRESPDSGETSNPPPAPDSGQPTAGGRPPAESTLPSSGIAPPAPLSRFTRAADAHARSESPEPATPSPDGPRPLLDLFPPPPAGDRGRGRPSAGSEPPERPVEARLPAIAGAPPPRIVRRFALQAEPAAPLPAAPLTYEPFYGLSENPFSLSTDPKFIYHSASHDRALQELINALGRGDRIMLLTGEPGIGKTTVCRSLIDQLGRRTVTSFIIDPVASLDDVLKTVLVDFGVLSREDATRGRLAAATAAVGDFAASLVPLQASAAIIVDEAQNVPPDILEALAALSEAASADRRVQIILAGQPALPSLLHREQLRELERSVAVHCRLEPLTADEVIGYVVHRLAVVGTSARVEFDDGAFAALHAATGGVPGLVNLVCDAALTSGYELSASVIDEQLIAGAAGNLELAPVRSDARSVARVVAMALALITLMLMGAGAAAWVFRAQLSRLLLR